MPSFRQMCERRCVEDLIHVIEQVPVRLAARWPIGLDKSSLAMVALWSLLRWERKFWLVCLEELGVDMWALTCELDALLEARKGVPPGDNFRDQAAKPPLAWFRQRLDPFLNALLDRAAHQASAMGHGYLGSEHVLLAIVADADPPLVSLLERHKIEYQNVKDAIVAALPRSPSPSVVEEAVPAIVVKKPWGAAWDSEAVGVPRRFSLAVLMLMMTLYAFLFAAMQSLGAHPILFAMITVLVTAVGLGQMLLFGGAYPRAASIWVGACLFPIELVAAVLISSALSRFPPSTVEKVGWTILSLVLGVPAGAFLGYLSGGVVGGVFLVLDFVVKRPSQETEGDPEGKPF